MSPIEITLILMLFLLFGSGVVGFIKKYEDKEERVGRHNLRIIEEDGKKYCGNCSKRTNVSKGDVFYNGNWFCLQCWQELTGIESNINEKKVEEKQNGI